MAVYPPQHPLLPGPPFRVEAVNPMEEYVCPELLPFSADASETGWWYGAMLLLTCAVCACSASVALPCSEYIPFSLPSPDEPWLDVYGHVTDMQERNT